MCVCQQFSNLADYHLSRWADWNLDSLKVSYLCLMPMIANGRNLYSNKNVLKVCFVCAKSVQWQLFAEFNAFGQTKYFSWSFQRTVRNICKVCFAVCMFVRCSVYGRRLVSLSVNLLLQSNKLYNLISISLHLFSSFPASQTTINIPFRWKKISLKGFLIYINVGNGNKFNFLPSSV